MCVYMYIIMCVYVCVAHQKCPNTHTTLFCGRIGTFLCVLHTKVFTELLTDPLYQMNSFLHMLRCVVQLS